MRRIVITWVIVALVLVGCRAVNPPAQPTDTPKATAPLLGAVAPLSELGNTRVKGTLNVTGPATLDSTLTVAGATTYSGAQTYSGTVAANAGITVDTTAFTVADTSGNVTTAGTIGQTLVNAAGGSANPYDYTGTLGIMNGSDDFTLFDVNITNANHTGSNTVQALDIANITGDAEATETAINIGTGWDAGITTGSLANLDAGIAVDTSAFTVADTSGDTVIAGSLAANGGISVDTSAFTVANTTGDVATAGKLSTGTWLILTQATTVAVGAGATITALGTMQPITSTAGVTTSTSTAIANGSTAGQLLILRNANASDTITVDGTGANVECQADIVLGTQDTITLIWNGSDWVCLSSRDN